MTTLKTIMITGITRDCLTRSSPRHSLPRLLRRRGALGHGCGRTVLRGQSSESLDIKRHPTTKLLERHTLLPKHPGTVLDIGLFHAKIFGDLHDRITFL